MAAVRKGKLPLVNFQDGSTYEGEWRDGKMHGRGIYSWPNGHVFEGDWRNGKMHGRGIQTWPGEESKRTDDFYARAFHKLGTRAHEAGQTDRAVKHFQDALRSDPTPDFRDKVQNDLDVLLSQCPPPSPPPPSPPSDTAVPSTADPPIPTLNEGRYEGDFRDGKKHGRGIHTWPNADRFEGEWRNGKMTGRGIYNFASGARYEGGYLKDKRTGRGIMTWPSGKRYVGNWQEDKFHGRGKFTTGQTGWTYSGDLEQDRPTEGELVEADGRRFKVTYDKTCAFICDDPNPKTKEPVPQSCVCM